MGSTAKSAREKIVSPQHLLTSSEVAALLQVNRASINKWVRDGLLNAYKTPGGHHRIRVSDLVQFLRAQELPIPPALSEVMRQRVLIVDDDPKQLRALERLLAPHNEVIELSLVDNGIDALVTIGSFRPHSILLDAYMPGLNGLEVLKRLRRLPDTRDTRIILASGQLTPKLRELAISAGADACLQKPVSLPALRQALRLATPTRAVSSP